MAKRALSLVGWIVFTLMLGKHAVAVIHANGVPIAGNDFPAFYCAGLIAREHADPYRVEPLRSCEHFLVDANDQPVVFVTPAPLPGYALAAFSALSLLPYKVAAWLWFLVLTAAIVAVAFALTGISKDRIPSGVAAIVLLFPAALAIVIYGQLPVLATLGIALAGIGIGLSTSRLWRYAQDDNEMYAGSRSAAFVGVAITLFGLTLAMIEPHLGLAALLAIALWIPAMRIWVGALALTLAAISLAMLGTHLNLEYFLQVLPIHAQAELGAIDQFSLSHVATFLGFHARIATAFGTLSYLIMLAFGSYFAKPLAKQLNAPEAIVYFPVAAILLGGSFLHEIQLIALLPLTFLIVGNILEKTWFKKIFLNPLFLSSILVVSIVALTPFSLYQEHYAKSSRNGVLSRNVGLTSAAKDGESEEAVEQARSREGGATIATRMGACRRAQDGLCRRLGSETVYRPRTSMDAVSAIEAPASASANWGVFLSVTPAYGQRSSGAEAAKVPFWGALFFLLSAAAWLARRTSTAIPRQLHLQYWLEGPEIRVT